jgi:hypothetical protein
MGRRHRAAAGGVGAILTQGRSSKIWHRASVNSVCGYLPVSDCGSIIFLFELQDC